MRRAQPAPLAPDARKMFDEHQLVGFFLHFSEIRRGALSA
jgi:hypothetical protein